MKLLIHPAIDQHRLQQIKAAAPNLTVIQTDNLTQAKSKIAETDAFFGKITPEHLAQTKQLTWVQTPTASLNALLCFWN